MPSALHPRRRPSIPRPVAHLAIALWVVVCGVACYWQVTVALAGDGLGWLYSVEWPAFGIFGIVVWWNLIHDDPTEVGSGAMRSGRFRPPAPNTRSRDVTTRREAESPELARYNEYLAALAASDKKKSWRG